MTNTELLEECISRKGIKKKKIAECLGISYCCLRKRIKNETSFKAEEIQKICALLNIDFCDEMIKIFFA